MDQFVVWVPEWVWPCVTLLAALALGVIVHWVTFFALARIAARTKNAIDDILVARYRRPSLLILPLLVLSIVLPTVQLDPDVATGAKRLITVGLIGGVAWMVIAGVTVVTTLIGARFDLRVSDNLAARRMHTQINVIRRVSIVVIVFIAGAAMLLTYPGLRDIGISLFASAGVAGLIVGLAARPTLSNLIAGIQIALTDPIRLDDVVIVEGEWGWIEEITTTYVVVRIWDRRRLVVPLTHFIEKPFQNWTRRTADILGTVFLHVDYTVPVDEVREELRRIVEGSELWNGEVCNLQVTNATDRTVELRALMSASTSPEAWDLRCLVRERLIAFLQTRFPDCLPKVRAEMRTPGADDSGGGSGVIAA